MSEGYKVLFRLRLDEKYKINPKSGKKEITNPKTEISSLVRGMGYKARHFQCYYEEEERNGNLSGWIYSFYFSTNKKISEMNIKKIKKEDSHILGLEHV